MAVPGVLGEQLGECEGQVQAFGDVVGAVAVAGEDHRGAQDGAGLVIQRWRRERLDGSGRRLAPWWVRVGGVVQAASGEEHGEPAGGAAVALVAATSEVRPSSQRAAGRFVDDLPTLDHLVRRT